MKCGYYRAGRRQAVQQFSDQSCSAGSYFCQHHATSFHYLNIQRECRETPVFAWQRAPVGQEYNWQVCDTCCGEGSNQLQLSLQLIILLPVTTNSLLTNAISGPHCKSIAPSEQLTAACCCQAGGEGWMSSWWQTGGWTPGKYGHNGD